MRKLFVQGSFKLYRKSTKREKRSERQTPTELGRLIEKVMPPRPGVNQRQQLFIQEPARRPRISSNRRNWWSIHPATHTSLTRDRNTLAINQGNLHPVPGATHTVQNGAAALDPRS